MSISASNRVRSLRSVAGLSLMDAAEASGYSVTKFWHIEQGKSAIDRAELSAIESALRSAAAAKAHRILRAVGMAVPA